VTGADADPVPTPSLRFFVNFSAPSEANFTKNGE
jgi:hypothetical protein